MEQYQYQKRYIKDGRGLPGGSDSKESACNAGDLGSITGSGRSPGEELPTPVFLPGEFYGQRSLVGYSPWGCKESDMTQRLTHTKRAEWLLVLARKSLCGIVIPLTCNLQLGC